MILTKERGLVELEILIWSRHFMKNIVGVVRAESNVRWILLKAESSEQTTIEETMFLAQAKEMETRLEKQ